MSTPLLALARVDLRSAFLGNLLASTAETSLRFLIGLVLARLLQPAELGLYALALALFGIAQMLRDCGVSSYLQREPELTPARFSACLGVLSTSTLLTTLALLLCAPALGRWSGQPALAPLLQVLALGLPLSAFGSAMAALQLRALAVARIARVSSLGVLTQGLLAISLSSAGCGVMGLVWAQIAAIAACGLAYATMRPPGLRWLPSWRAGLNWRAWRAWREVLGFGAAALLANALSTLHAATPELLLGRLGTAHQLGLLGRAQATVGLLQTLTGQALNFGALPALAARHARAQALAPALLRGTALLTGLAWPLLALTGVHGAALVQLLYGSQWLDGVPAVLPLALAAGVGLPFSQLGAALTAIARPGWAALPTAVALLLRLSLCLWMFDGSVSSFAWALCAVACATLPFQCALAWRFLGLTPRALLTAVAGSALAAGAVCVVPPAWAAPVWLLVLLGTGHPLAGELLQVARRRMTSRK